MKITKLIIPLLGLTTINNVNKEQLLQIEKLPEISCEVSATDNWDNYLTNTNTIENITYSQQDKGQNKIVAIIIPQSEFKNILVNNGKKPPINQLNGCDALYQTIMATCASMPNYAKKKACEAAAWLSYLGCIGF
jgi:hypothetical protein